MITATEDDIQRLFGKIEVVGECWEWRGSLSWDGYGYAHLTIAKGKYANLRAHRLFYQLLIDDIPKGLQCDHVCENRSCVNPMHIELTTPNINNSRSLSPTAINKVKTHCASGHEFTDANTYLHITATKRERQCRMCRKIAQWKRSGYHVKRTRICEINDCNNKHVARGMCHAHFQRNRSQKIKAFGKYKYEG